MSDKAFVDTNIFVYARDSGAGTKHDKAKELIAGLWKSQSGRISVQILNEYFVTVTQKLKPGMSHEKAWKDIESLQAWTPIPIDWRLLEQARGFHRKHSLSWWDSLVIAGAQKCGCSILYSEDLTHEEVYAGVKVVNPFL